MRKLSLNKLNLGEGNLLQREQLKSVLGGHVDICPEGNCTTDSDCSAPYSGCYTYECAGDGDETRKLCGY